MPIKPVENCCSCEKNTVVCMTENCTYCSFVCSMRGPQAENEASGHPPPTCTSNIVFQSNWASYCRRFLLNTVRAIYTVHVGSVVLYDDDNCNTTTSQKMNNLGAIAVWVVPFWHTDDATKQQTAQRLGTCRIAIQGTNYPNGYYRILDNLESRSTGFKVCGLKLSSYLCM